LKTTVEIIAHMSMASDCCNWLQTFGLLVYL